MKHPALVLALTVVWVLPTLAKNNTTVKIISGSDTTSTYVLSSPGSNSVNCAGASTSVSCTGTTIPAIAREMQVTGHVLYLQLPDKRVVVVACNAKPNWTDWSQGPYRNCRLPFGDTAQADISGDKVKLMWSVSLDGKKTENETYKILGVLLPQ